MKEVVVRRTYKVTYEEKDQEAIMKLDIPLPEDAMTRYCDSGDIKPLYYVEGNWGMENGWFEADDVASDISLDWSGDKWDDERVKYYIENWGCEETDVVID
jgi:hypothetical protein